MASTIKTLRLECETISLPVALRGASEKRDVSFGRAAPVVVGEGKNAKVTPTKIVRMDIADPGPEAESVAVAQLVREKGKIKQKQFEGEELRGVWDGDEFYEIKPEEIAQIEERTTFDTLTIQEFIPLADIPWERAQASYFLAPGSGSGPAVLKMLVTLREAMERKGVAGVAKLMPKSRQKLAVIYPKHGGLMVTCLAYADTYQQVLTGAASMEGVEVSDTAVELTEKLIELKAASVDALDEYRDDVIDLRADLVERAKLGEALTADEEPETEAVEALPPTALEEALRASVQRIQDEKKKRGKKTARKASGAAPKRAAATSGRKSA